MSIGQPTTRRSVLQFVVLGACFTGLDVRALRAQAKREGKPLLTQDNMNKMLAQQSTAKERTEMAAEIAKDPANFLKQHFAVTSQQIKEIDSISKDQMAEAGRVVQDAVRNGRWVTVGVSKDGCDVTVQWIYDEPRETDPEQRQTFRMGTNREGQPCNVSRVDYHG